MAQTVEGLGGGGKKSFLVNGEILKYVSGSLKLKHNVPYNHKGKVGFDLWVMHRIFQE